MPRQAPSWTQRALSLACAALAAWGCAGGQEGASGAGSTTEHSSPSGALDPARAAVDEAREQLPTYLALHTRVIARTCTPNAGVCHNSKEYPDLRTPQTMLGILGQPCNLDASAPESVFNGCEREGDAIELLGPSNPGFASEVGYVSHELDDATGETVALVLHTRDPIPMPMLDPSLHEDLRLSRRTKQGVIEIGALVGKISYNAGESRLRIDDYAGLTAEERSLVEQDIAPGDPNQDGVFGAAAGAFKLILPGDPRRSYLLQRLQGNVPGSPMPLANEPLSGAEIVALACWIEGLADAALVAVDAAINYDDCRTAEGFGAPNPASGHALGSDVQPIFDRSCARSGCHDAESAEAGLVLTPGRSRASLLDESTQFPGVPRVEVGNPTHSYLVHKLTGGGTIRGAAMPIGPDGAPGTLAGEEIAIIRAWIVAGAPED